MTALAGFPFSVGDHVLWGRRRVVITAIDDCGWDYCPHHRRKVGCITVLDETRRSHVTENAPADELRPLVD